MLYSECLFTVGAMETARRDQKSRWIVVLTLALCACALVAWWRGSGAGAELGVAAALGAMLLGLYTCHAMQAAQQGMYSANELLTTSLNALDIGLEIWDGQDRLVFFNKWINHMRIDFRTPKDIGKSFEELVRDKLQRREILEAVGREEEWLAQRLATRGSSPKPQLKEYAGNQWFMTYETRTPAGYLVASWVDVTELVQKGRMLEDSNLRLLQQSNRDLLTGLANRRHFDETLSAECQRAARADVHLSLLLVGVDHFKSFNDHYGHPAGDECLRRVASVLHRCVRRAGEMVARYREEEFVVLLPGSDDAHARKAAQQCLDCMQSEGIAHPASLTAEQVTLSIGVASARERERELVPSNIMDAADAAMYRAKSGGRARYEMAGHEDWEYEKDSPRSRPGDLR